MTVDLYADREDTGSAATDGTLNLLDASAQPFTTGLTWNTYDGANAWTTPGGDTGAVLSSIVGISSDDVTFDDVNDVPSQHTFASTTALVAAVQAAYDSGPGARAQFALDFALPASNDRNLLRFDAAAASETSEGTGNGGIGPSITIEYVPEPGSLALLALGGLCVLTRRRAA